MKYKMTKEERRAEAEAIRKALPLKPSERVIDDFMKEDYGAGMSPFRSVYVTDEGSGKKTKKIEVLCCHCLKKSLHEYAAIPRAEVCHLSYTMQPRDNYGLLFQKEDVRATGDGFFCPECRRWSTLSLYARHKWRVIKEKKHYVMELHAVRGHLVVMLFNLVKYVDREGKESFYHDNEHASYQVDGQMFRANGYESWCMGKNYVDGWIPTLGSFTEAIGGMFPKHCYWDMTELDSAEELNDGLIAYLNEAKKQPYIYAERYLSLWAKAPNIENVAKTYPAYTAKLIADTYYSTIYKAASTLLNLKETKPHKIIGVKKDILKEAIKKDDPSKIFLYRLYRERKTDIPKFLKDMHESEVDRLICFLGDPTVKKVAPPIPKLVRYLYTHQRKKGYCTTHTTLRDYWRMMLQINGEITQDIMFPKDLNAAHDRAAKEISAQASALINKQIAQRAKKLEKMAFTDLQTGLLIRPARSFEELRHEGKELHHCVASYADDVAAGKTTILFIRHIDSPEKPFFTLEYKGNRVNQNRGYCNCARTPEVEAFESKWLKYLKEINYGKRNNRSIAAGAGA